jgi:twitching motility protein PilT
MTIGLGDVLVQHGTISQTQLTDATAHQQQQGVSLGRAVLDLGFASQDDLMQAAATQLGMRFIEVKPTTVDMAAVGLVPQDLASEIEAVPVGFGKGNAIVVAIANPNNRGAADRVTQHTGQAVELVLAPRAQVLDAIRHLSPVAVVDDRQAAPGSQGLTADAPVTVVSAEPRLRSETGASVDLNELLAKLVESGGSDLHLTAGVAPSVRVHGDMQQLPGYPQMVPDELQGMLYAIMTQKQREEFENNLELDMSYEIAGLARFRVNVFQQRQSIASVMRVIPFEIMTLEQLGIPAQVSNLAFLPRGFVLVTGPTGSGKSTTLAALIDTVNEQRAAHIMTIEDPIEFLHEHKKSVVNQREIGTDSYSFTAALKHVLRQDPDVILVGELRDLETIQIALTAAETGHLVFGTLHTQDAPQSIDRIIDVFPPHQQEQIRVMLAGALKGVVCQTLLKTADGKGRTVATEIMTATSGIKNLIREGKTHQIYSAMQAGASHGMVTMDQSLATLVKKGTVTYDDALDKCSQVSEFNRLAGRG